ncbi:MAG: hypothetical protein Q7J23_06960 [Nitrosomonas sp.]|uniref:hypothetical protein n=1 Tax=Nitrosomonas sp. TaxID=42353 RepID=UPI00271AD86D|nr:hypothetical protein [Nitrosomonas sp.]MDO8895291.1 hypothetical protein [Nitrosomonas sp.]MDO9470447.1 hypothetical protein [Nitrosomonas sp.]MDP1787463.1 hypothetical protein [Nitrosomonas sp.]MDP2224349.1 hypothetical protein [Nitrosomonas sp.]
MQYMFFDKILRIIFCAAALGYAGVSSAHDAGATMDPNGNVASFTGYARVTCFDDGNGPADYLMASIKDTSLPQDNLLVNLQIIKGDQAISTTDPVSGDGNFSPTVSVHGGNGVYLLLVNKTAAGARSFLVSYHCVTASEVHTGTDISVKQFE